MIKFNLSTITPQVTSERLKGYKWILFGQVIVLVNFLILYDWLSKYSFSYWQEIMLFLTGSLMIAMNYLTYELIKDLTDSKFIQRLIWYLLWTGIVLGIVTSLPILTKGSSFYNFVSIVSLSASLISFFLLFYFMVLDIFNEKHEITYKLWGSACIYLVIGASFGLLYTILAVIVPVEFGFSTDVAFDIFQFIPCYNFSFYTISGIDSSNYNFSSLIRNISVIEAIFSNLFIVLIVGRLLAK